jgi:hypothetical protein
MEFDVIQWLVKNRLVPGQPEGETSRAWNMILNEIFKLSEGYSTGPEMLMGSGKSDLFTAHLVFDVRHSEKKFLVVECKAPGLESQTGVWDEAVVQLQRYLNSITSRNRKFGAIAVGRVVRFFELQGRSLVDFDGDGDIYYLDRQCQSVTGKLTYFRAHHLDK